MEIIDVKTVFIIYVITSALCAVMITSLWLHNRKRFPGITLWLFSFILQFVAIVLILLRGVVPDFASIVIANTFVVGGTVLFYIGLERFVDKQSSQIHNYVMLGVFIILHAYFTYGYPDLPLRNINLSLGFLFVCVQASWLMLRRVEPQMRPATRATGIILAIFCLVNLARIGINFSKWKDAGGNANLFHYSPFDAIILVTYVVLFIGLTFALFILVNRRLSMELEDDLIEREQTQNFLRESEERYRSILDNILEGYFETNLKGDIVFANASACNLLGYDKETLYKINYRQFSTPETKNKFQKIYRDVLRTGNPSKVSDYEIIRGDGIIRINELSVALLRDSKGKPAGFRTVARDITERKQAEEKIRESEESISAITDSAHDAIIMMDNNGNISYWNPAAEQILGYKKEEVIGLNLHELLTPERFLPDYLAAHPEFQKTGKGNAVGKTLELPARRKDGQEIDITLSLSAVSIKGAWHAVGIMQDISERKLSQELIRIRLFLFEFAANHSLDELLQKTLDEVGILVNSPIGFYHFLEEDQKTLSLQAWSTRTLNEFCKAEGKGMHYRIDQAGVWVDCVREMKPVVHNDYNSLPHRKGLPQGHAAVIRELVVPIIRGKNIVAILGVGNKPTEYNDKDIEIVSYLADVAWEITERKRTEERIRQSEEKLKEAQHIAQLGNWELDLTTNTLQWSDGIYELFEIDPMEFGASYEAFLNAIHPDDRAMVNQAYTESLKNKTPYEIVHRLLMKDGRIKWVKEICRSEFEKQGNPLKSFGVVQDITRHKLAEEALDKYSNDLKERMKELNCLYSVSEIVRKEGISQEEILKLCPAIISKAYRFPEITACRIMWDGREYKTQNFRKTQWSQSFPILVHGQQAGSIEVYCLGGDNQECYDDFFSAEESDILKNIAELLGRSAERKQAQEQIKHMATHDPLTDLPTLRLAEDRLAMAMGRASRHKEKAAIMFIDLDGFKKVNDTLGHEAGDVLLKTLAQRFLSSIRKTDTIARIGGDEFLLIATELKSADDAALIAKKLLKQASQPFEIEGQKPSVTASIGIAFYPDHGEDINELIKLADEAMYKIKNSSKNGFAFAKYNRL